MVGEIGAMAPVSLTVVPGEHPAMERPLVGMNGNRSALPGRGIVRRPPGCRTGLVSIMTHLFVPQSCDIRAIISDFS